MGRKRTRKSLLIEYPRLDIASVDVDTDEVVEPLLGKRHLEHAGIVSRTVADKEVLAAQVAVISSGEIDDPPDIPLVRFHVILLVFSTRIDESAELPLLMPQRHPARFYNLRNIKFAAEDIRLIDMAANRTKKKEGR